MCIFSQRYQAEINDLENLGEIGSGTCGQVWKMRFKKTGHIIAVKVRPMSGCRNEGKTAVWDLEKRQALGERGRKSLSLYEWAVI